MSDCTQHRYIEQTTGGSLTNTANAEEEYKGASSNNRHSGLRSLMSTSTGALVDGRPALEQSASYPQRVGYVQANLQLSTHYRKGTIHNFAQIHGGGSEPSSPSDYTVAARPLAPKGRYAGGSGLDVVYQQHQTGQVDAPCDFQKYKDVLNGDGHCTPQDLNRGYGVANHQERCHTNVVYAESRIDFRGDTLTPLDPNVMRGPYLGVRSTAFGPGVTTGHQGHAVMESTYSDGSYQNDASLSSGSILYTQISPNDPCLVDPTLYEAVDLPSPDGVDNSPVVLKCSFNDCDKPFTGRWRKGNLGRHHRQKHCDRSVHPCGVGNCKRSFKRTDARLKHLRKYHPDLNTAPAMSRKASPSTSSRHAHISHANSPCVDWRDDFRDDGFDDDQPDQGFHT